MAPFCTLGARRSYETLDIGVGRHDDEKYDRIAFHFGGGLPDYHVCHLAELTADTCGAPSPGGWAYLRIVMNPVYAHSPDGRPTVVTVGKAVSVGYPMLRAFVITDDPTEGDRVGYVTVKLRLDRPTGFRVGQLPERNIFYLDVEQH